MGEARRRKLAGNTKPDPNYKKPREMTRKQWQELQSEILVDSIAGIMGLLMGAQRRRGLMLPPSYIDKEKPRT